MSDTATRADGASTSGVAELGLERAQVEATLEPLERASMLPPPAFTDSSVFAWELEHLFTRGWICVGHVSSVAEPGTFVTREVGSESVLVVGGKDDRPHAFFNVCRHRGARIAEEAEGRFRARITCPYHAWSYGFDGGLVGTRHMEGLEDFDPGCYGLRPVDVEVVGGLVLVELGGAAPPVAGHVGELAGLLDRYRTSELERAGARTYKVEANWKAIAENYSECLHCPGVHPELNALSHYRSGEEIAGEGLWCGGSMTLREGAETMGRDGGSGGGRPAITGLEDADRNLVLYFVLFPNALISLHPDYVMLHTLWPRDAGHTEVTCEWFFEPETAAAPGFDPEDAIDFWDQVNREDWHVCELAQKGMRSRGYTAGRYSNQEGDVHAFDVMVAERYMEAL